MGLYSNGPGLLGICEVTVGCASCVDIFSPTSKVNNFPRSLVSSANPNLIHTLVQQFNSKNCCEHIYWHGQWITLGGLFPLVGHVTINKKVYRFLVGVFENCGQRWTQPPDVLESNLSVERVKYI